MKIYVIQAVANHNEAGGTSKFLHKRAFVDLAVAEAFVPEFVKGIESETNSVLTYCNVKAVISELELVERDSK
jgi:hypothetical protein